MRDYGVKNGNATIGVEKIQRKVKNVWTSPDRAI